MPDSRYNRCNKALNEALRSGALTVSEYRTITEIRDRVSASKVEEEETFARVRKRDKGVLKWMS